LLLFKNNPTGTCFVFAFRFSYSGILPGCHTLFIFSQHSKDLPPPIGELPPVAIKVKIQKKQIHEEIQLWMWNAIANLFRLKASVMGSKI